MSKKRSCSVPWRLEIEAIAECVDLLEPLAPEERVRVLRYLWSRYADADRGAT